ncbi:NF038129 family PEP-CTERM protein [Pseudoduganella umbonata]|uniref:PEP-CTERM sorting domain-containing protein n=1 Tax=Pseudoduganella umbonata TaxID=864828 RepID=A0A7W5EGJ2_9BURK|nr:NF038129 family PEP-CTERM protein [Pseudoduganella umbonata]MBB3224897.1 hypothetical protein [Pseudoduganella umbonata]
MRLALLLALATGTGNALASPIYHVALDTTSLAGQHAWLDFLFTGLDNAAPAQATVTGFTADTGGVTLAEGDVSGSLASALVIGNGSGWNEYGQWLQLGGLLEFDVAFDLGPAGAGTSLVVTLLDDRFGYLAGTGDLVTFALQPGAGTAVSADSAFAAVSAIPEPGSLAVLGTGLLLMMATRRFGRRR